MNSFRFKKDVPAWVQQLTRAYAELFGIMGWEINVEMHDAPGTRGTAEGDCSLNTRYRIAFIRIRRNLVNDELGRLTVFHEVTHVALALIDEAVDVLLDLYVPKEARQAAYDIYSRAEEPTIEQLVRGVDRRLEFTFDEEETALKEVDLTLEVSSPPQERQTARRPIVERVKTDRVR